MNQQLKLPTISAKEFKKRLGKRKLEDLSVIQMIERYFNKTRGYVFRMPKPNSPVILLTSGGLDSTIAWAVLMDIYHLQVYPLYIGTENRQYKALRSIAKIYKRRNLKYYHDPFVVNESILPKGFKKYLKISHINPKQILERYNKTNENVMINGLNGLNAFSLMHAYIYTITLQLSLNIHVDTVFCGVAAGDGGFIPSQTLTFLRSTMMLLSLFSKNRKFQYSSIFLEKECGLFLEKSDEIRIAEALSVPVDNTYSCYRNGIFHCGECLSCYSRHLEFTKAGISDPTQYWRPHESFRYHFFFLLKLLPKPVYTVGRKIKRFLI